MIPILLDCFRTAEGNIYPGHMRQYYSGIGYIAIEEVQKNFKDSLKLNPGKTNRGGRCPSGDNGLGRLNKRKVFYFIVMPFTRGDDGSESYPSGSRYGGSPKTD